MSDPRWPPPPWSDARDAGSEGDRIAERRRKRGLRLAIEGDDSGTLAELEAVRREARDALGSTAYEVGALVTASGRHPSRALRLPVDLLRLRRRRQVERAAFRARVAARQARAARTRPPPRTLAPDALFHAFDVGLPQSPDLPRLALVGPDGLGSRLGAAAHAYELRPMAAWRGLVPGTDALVVAASAGRRGPWFGLGTGDVPERDAALRELLERADAVGTPAVLLHDRGLGGHPALRALIDRFAAVLGEPTALWDAGLDWRTEGPLGPRRQVADLLLDAGLAGLGAAVPADDSVVAITSQPGATHPIAVRLGARWVETTDGAVIGALVRGATRVLVSRAASAAARRLAATSGKQVDNDGDTWPDARPGKAEAASGRRALCAVAGSEDVAARVNDLVRALGGRSGPTRPTVSVVLSDHLTRVADVLLDRLSREEQVLEVIPAESAQAARRARGDFLLRPGAWVEDGELVQDVLAAASYADGAALAERIDAAPVGESTSTRDAVLVRRSLAAGPGREPWAIEGARLAVLARGADR